MREFAARTAPEEIERVVEKEFREDALLARKVKLYFYHNYTNQSVTGHFKPRQGGAV
jgi:hypothetical protein